MQEKNNIVNFDEHKKKLEAEKPRMLTFYSAVFRDEAGNSDSQSVSVTVMDGDALGILQVVKSDGYLLFRQPDGSIGCLPWPCAMVECRDLTPEEIALCQQPEEETL